jgi:uncharacterized protein (DUF4415 family)
VPCADYFVMTICSRGNISSCRERMYDCVMTRKSKKTKKRAARPRTVELQASAEDELLLVAAEDARGEARWNRPRKQRISLRVDTEVVDWFKSKGPGYQTRINRILRTVMVEGKKRGER